MAVAGIIVGVMTLTGLALRLAGIIVDLAGGSLVLTAFCRPPWSCCSASRCR